MGIACHMHVGMSLICTHLHVSYVDLANNVSWNPSKCKMYVHAIELHQRYHRDSWVHAVVYTNGRMC